MVTIIIFYDAVFVQGFTIPIQCANSSTVVNPDIYNSICWYIYLSETNGDKVLPLKVTRIIIN